MKYTSFDSAMKSCFGGKVYRLALSSGCSCPNRDGSISTGGCIFCSEGGSGDFAAAANKTVTEQIEEAKLRVAAKLSKNFAGYVAYFQSFTNTYGDPADLRRKYIEAASHPEVLAVSIATRPDCLGDEIMKVLSEVNQIKPVWVELGLQTIHEETAKIINRGYSLDVYDEAVKRLKAAGIEVITHVIIGLPGETDEMIKQTVGYVCNVVHTDGIKLQLLHVLKNTKLAQMYEENPDIIHEYTLDEYANLLVELLKIIPEGIIVHRITGDAPKKLLLVPEWTVDKKKVLNTVNKRILQS